MAAREPMPPPQAIALRRIVEALVAELHPQRSPRVTLDADFERDLGLDSLARTELLARIERELGVSLASTLLAEATTPRDLIEAMALDPCELADAAVGGPFPLEHAAESAPAHVRTLDEVLLWHAQRHPDRPHIVLPDDRGHETVLTYGALARAAASVADGLVRKGLPAGGRVAIMLPTGSDFFVAFFGAMLAGGVPVPIYPPARRNQLEAHLRRQAGILVNAGARILVTWGEARLVANLLASQVKELAAVETIASLTSADEPSAIATTDGDALAMLQYTSGSTGAPKGVVLTHANLLANMRAMGAAAAVGPEDRLVSWLPLYHDMGLIGSWLTCMYFAIPTVIMSPLSFLTKPSRWLWTIHRHRATISPAPNFGFELCLRGFDPQAYEGIDLGCLRMMPNGAEPVSASTIRRFTEAFAPFGLRESAMAPVYGLAENAVALAFPPPGRAPPIDCVSRTELARSGRARPVPNEAADVREVVACGRPLVGHEVRVVDAAGRELPERSEGEVQFRGPSATSGYYDNPGATARLFDGSWLRTGDRGYIANGDIHLTGRIKDLIIRAGRNIHPHEIEQLVGELAGVRRGCVAAFGARDARLGTERLVVVAETRELDDEQRVELRAEIGRVAHDLIAMPPDDVVLAQPGTVLKTSSGKIRRAATREAYEAGRLGPHSRALWWQVVRLFASGLAPRLRRALREAIHVAYAGWFWAVGISVASLAWLLVAVLPRRYWRWLVFRAASRTHLWLAGIAPAVRASDRMPPPRCIYVCNHASYIDALVVGAAVPGPFVFAVKGELAGNFVTRTFLRRLGALFVERFDAERGAQATRELLTAVEAGERLLVFAEGTLTRRPGLAQFRLGAFVLAGEASVPIVPVVLRGTRSVLRDGQWLPHREAIAVTIGAPIAPEGSTWDAAVRLRDRVRAEMLRTSGEPDLAQEEHPLSVLRRELAERAMPRS